MTLSEQIKFIDTLGAREMGDIKEALNDVKQSLNHLNGMYVKTAPKLELYDRFVACYYKFMIEKVPYFEFTGRDGKALKEIVGKLLKCKGINSESEALHSYEYILSNWSSLNTFMQGQKTLTQMNKYLVEILDQLKNGHYQTAKQSTAKTAVNDAQSAIEKRRQARADARKN